MKRVLFLLVVVFVLCPFLLPVQAEIPDFYITPNKFSFSSYNGQSINGEIRVVNDGDEALNVLLSTQLPDNNAIPLAQRLNPDWITLGQKNLSLPAHTSVPVSFKIVVPDNVSGRDYVAVVLARVETESFQVEKSAHILVDVFDNGIEQLYLESFQPKSYIVFNDLELGVKLRNIGTTFAKPYGSVQITDLNGNLKAELPLTTTTILAGAEYDKKFTYTLPLGIYHVYLSLHYAQDIKSITNRATVIVIPAGFFFLVISVPVIFILYRRYRWTRRKKHFSRSA